MGYSCTAKAAYVVEAIDELMDKHYPGEATNRMPDGGFWERGRENDDGAITGTVWKPVRRYTDEERKAAAEKMGGGMKPEWVGDPCVRRGSFKISADGKLVRFPGLPRGWKAEAEAMAAKKYREKHETPWDPLPRLYSR